MNEALILGLIGAIVAHGVVLLMKSPKEVNKELGDQIIAIREDQQELSHLFARHDEVMKHLIQSLDRLATRIDRLEPFVGKTSARR